jgi:hypothetical protein
MVYAPILHTSLESRQTIYCFILLALHYCCREAANSLNNLTAISKLSVLSKLTKLLLEHFAINRPHNSLINLTAPHFLRIVHYFCLAKFRVVRDKFRHCSWPPALSKVLGDKHRRNAYSLMYFYQY